MWANFKYSRHLCLLHNNIWNTREIIWNEHWVWRSIVLRLCNLPIKTQNSEQLHYVIQEKHTFIFRYSHKDTERHCNLDRSREKCQAWKEELIWAQCFICSLHSFILFIPGAQSFRTWSEHEHSVTAVGSRLLRLVNEPERSNREHTQLRENSPSDWLPLAKFHLETCATTSKYHHQRGNNGQHLSLWVVFIEISMKFTF